jgi:hypothetical protein
MSEELEKNVSDPFTSYADIICRDGVKRRVYPAKLKYKDIIRDLSQKFDDTVIISNVYDFNGDSKDNHVAWDAMMEVLYIAFDKKFTKEEIEDFLDLALARQVFEIFYDISSFKKKQAQMNQA